MIKINLKVTNFNAGPQVRTYLEKKLRKIEKLVTSSENDSELILRVEIGRTTKHHQQGDIYRAEMQIHYSGEEIRATEESEDVFSAIDLTQEELLGIIKRVKGKQETLVRRTGARVKDFIRKFYR